MKLRKVRVFNNVSIDGYFTAPDGDYLWAHEGADDPDVAEFTRNNAEGESALIFGRVTYDLMVAWWPTPQAAMAMPEVTRGMNQAPKYVFTRSLQSAGWANTTLLHEDPASAISRMKDSPGPDLVVLGSGTIVAQLTAAGLVDEIQLLIVPIILGSGRNLFTDVSGRPWWKVTKSKTFKNGRVFVAYERR